MDASFVLFPRGEWMETKRLLNETMADVTNHDNEEHTFNDI